MPRTATECEAVARSWVKTYLRYSPGKHVTARRLIKLCGVHVPCQLHYIVQAMSKVFGPSVKSTSTGVGGRRKYTNVAVNAPFLCSLCDGLR